SNFTYAKVSLAFTARAFLGNYNYNNVQSSRATYQGVFPGQPFLNNTTTNIYDTQFQGADKGRIQLSDYYVQKASFVRMDNISLGYDFGSLISQSTSLRLNLSLQNAFVITGYKGVDPEIVSVDNLSRSATFGIDNNFYPRPRTITAGINIGF
ncbi:SusC/RagA family protein, partial [Hymenobacter rubripertinctus]